MSRCIPPSSSVQGQAELEATHEKMTAAARALAAQVAQPRSCVGAVVTTESPLWLQGDAASAVLQHTTLQDFTWAQASDTPAVIHTLPTPVLASGHGADALLQRRAARRLP